MRHIVDGLTPKNKLRLTFFDRGAAFVFCFFQYTFEMMISIGAFWLHMDIFLDRCTQVAVQGVSQGLSSSLGTDNLLIT